MNELPVESLVFIVLMLISIVAYFLKKAFKQLDDQGKEIDDIKLNCKECSAGRFDEVMKKFNEMLDEKLESWWMKIENGLMKEGRLSTRERNKRDGREP